MLVVISPQQTGNCTVFNGAATELQPSTEHFAKSLIYPTIILLQKALLRFLRYLELGLVSDDVEVCTLLPEEVGFGRAAVGLGRLLPCQPVPHVRIVGTETPAAPDTAPLP